MSSTSSRAFTAIRAHRTSSSGVADVRNPDDTLGADWVAMAEPVLAEEETAVRQVAALGYTPEDVRHIVVTHLDVDHCGGLPDFPDAQVHVLAKELEAATAQADPLRGRPRPPAGHPEKTPRAGQARRRHDLQRS